MTASEGLFLIRMGSVRLSIKFNIQGWASSILWTLCNRGLLMIGSMKNTLFGLESSKTVIGKWIFYMLNFLRG